MGGQVPSIQGVTRRAKTYAQIERGHVCKENFSKKRKIRHNIRAQHSYV